jgi:poly(A) polymerase
MRFAYVDKMKEAKLKRFLSLPNFTWHIQLHNADCLGSHGDVSNSLYCEQKIREFAGDTNIVELPKPLVNGHDLIALGMKPGPEFKVLLDKALDLQLEGKTREEILKEVF